MGMLSRFYCSGCDYEARVAGGRGALFAGPTVTVSCASCRELYDVVSWNREDLEGLERGDRWSVAVPTPETTHLTEPTCPVGADHTLELWEHPGACPRCGATLAMDESDFVLAD